MRDSILIPMQVCVRLEKTRYLGIFFSAWVKEPEFSSISRVSNNRYDLLDDKCLPPPR